MGLEKKYNTIIDDYKQQLCTLEALIEKEKSKKDEDINRQQTEIEKLRTILDEEQKKTHDINQIKEMLQEEKNKVLEIDHVRRMLNEEKKKGVEFEKMKQ